MKYLLYMLLSLSFISCTQENTKNYIIKYGPKEVQSAEFINTLMILGFTKHGRSFYSQIHDLHFFEEVRTETLQYFIKSIFYSSLSQKYKIKITDAELETWIKKRTPDLKKEDLIFTLKANNFSYGDWKKLFREQFIQNKIVEQLTESDLKSKKETRQKKSADDALFMAVITFEDELKAKSHYRTISRSVSRYDDILKKENNTSYYSWVKTKDIPFYSKIKHLALRRVSKPIETKWGYSLVRIKKKGKYPLPNKNVASGQKPSPLKPLLEEFKKDPKLDINTDLLYSLKIKK